MQTGFSYNGKHSRDFGYVVMQTQKRPVLPSRKRVTFEPSALDGVLDLSASNDKGRALFNERVFSLNLMIKADDIAQLQSRISAVCGWLSGEGDLSFDDLPEVIWKARIIDSVEFAPESQGKKAALSVNFVTEPFSFAKFNTHTGIPIGSKIRLGSRLPIGLSRQLELVMESSSQEMIVRNLGTAPVSPKITISHNTPSATVLSVGLGDREVSIDHVTADTAVIVIDMDTCEITIDGVSALPLPGFAFFELLPGENTLRIAASVGDKVTVSYTPRFIYGWEACV